MDMPHYVEPPPEVDEGEMVELRVRIPRSWRHILQAGAARQSISMGALVRSGLHELVAALREGMRP